MNCNVFESLFTFEKCSAFDIHTAASIGCEERIQDLIENESKSILNKQNSTGWSSLMYAACSGNLKVIALLLEEGACTSIKNNMGHTALMLSAKYGNTDVAAMLITYRANVNDTDIKGWSALSLASSYGHRSVVQLLIGKNATIDVVEKTDGCTPLMIAASAGHEMIVWDLLQHGANSLKQSKNGDTAYTLAVKNNHFKVKTILDAHVQSIRHTNKSVITMPIDMRSLFKNLQLSKYYEIFERQNIDLDTFWLLNEDDLKEIGIQLLGPRKKICAEIARWHQHQLLKANPTGTSLESKLISERQTLMHQIEQIQRALSNESMKKEIAEHELSKNIETLKILTGNVQQNISVALLLHEKLKQSHLFLKDFLINATKNQRSHLRFDIAIPLMNDIEKISDEVHRHILLTSQMTQF